MDWRGYVRECIRMATALKGDWWRGSRPRIRETSGVVGRVAEATRAAVQDASEVAAHIAQITGLTVDSPDGPRQATSEHIAARFGAPPEEVLIPAAEPVQLILDPALTACLPHERGNPAPTSDGDWWHAQAVFNALSDEAKAGIRRQWAHSQFATGRLFLVIGPQARLSDVQRIWPEVQRVQFAVYGAPPPQKETRGRTYQRRLEAARLASVKGRMADWVRSAVRGRSRPAFFRRLAEARRDLGESPQQPLQSPLAIPATPEDFERHVAECPQCREAKKADQYCSTVQGWLGPRDERIKGAFTYDDKTMEGRFLTGGRKRPTGPGPS